MNIINYTFYLDPFYYSTSGQTGFPFAKSSLRVFSMLIFISHIIISSSLRVKVAVVTLVVVNMDCYHCSMAINMELSYQHAVVTNIWM